MPALIQLPLKRDFRAVVFFGYFEWVLNISPYNRVSPQGKHARQILHSFMGRRNLTVMRRRGLNGTWPTLIPHKSCGVINKLVSVFSYSFPHWLRCKTPGLLPGLHSYRAAVMFIFSVMQKEGVSRMACSWVSPQTLLCSWRNHCFININNVFSVMALFFSSSKNTKNRFRRDAFGEAVRPSSIVLLKLNDSDMHQLHNHPRERNLLHF